MSANILPFSDSELAALKTTVNEVRSSADVTDGWSVNVWIAKITGMTQVSEFSSRVLQEGNKEAFTSILFEAEETKGRTTPSQTNLQNQDSSSSNSFCTC